MIDRKKRPCTSLDPWRTCQSCRRMYAFGGKPDIHNLRGAPNARSSDIWRNLPLRTPSLRHDDVAATSLLEVWIDKAERRTWLLNRVSLNRSRSRKETRAMML